MAFDAITLTGEWAGSRTSNASRRRNGGLAGPAGWRYEDLYWTNADSAARPGTGMPRTATRRLQGGRREKGRVGLASDFYRRTVHREE
jgi:hypothetical protein